MLTAGLLMYYTEMAALIIVTIWTMLLSFGYYPQYRDGQKSLLFLTCFLTATVILIAMKKLENLFINESKNKKDGR